MKEIFSLDIDLNKIYSLFDEMADNNKAIDKPKQFLEEILNDLDSNRQTIFMIIILRLIRYMQYIKIKQIVFI